MTARVTQGMMNAQLIRNLNANMMRNNHYQNQLSTGRKINAPSDDPVGITFSMRYRTELSANDQYQRNLDSAVSYMEFTDKMLDQAGNVIHRIRELATNGANGTNPTDAMKAIQIEVGQLYDQLVTIGNSKLNDKYVFNGQNTSGQPYSTTSITDNDPTSRKAYQDAPDASAIRYQLGAGVQIPVNVSGLDAFGDPADPDHNLFQIVSDLYDALGQDDHEAVGQTLGRLDVRMGKLLQARAEVGARMNRIELVENRLKDININLQTLKSNTEDADLAEVITNLKMGENVYQASLSVGAKLISPSLVDFLR